MQYIKNIIYFTLFSAILQQLLPKEEYRKYARILTGFILLLLFLTPLFSMPVSQGQWNRCKRKFQLTGQKKRENGRIKKWCESVPDARELAMEQMLLESGYGNCRVKIKTQQDTIKEIKITVFTGVSKEQLKQLKTAVSKEFSLEDHAVKIYRKGGRMDETGYQGVVQTFAKSSGAGRVWKNGDTDTGSSGAARA